MPGHTDHQARVSCTPCTRRTGILAPSAARCDWPWGAYPGIHSTDLWSRSGHTCKPQGPGGKEGGSEGVREGRAGWARTELPPCGLLLSSRAAERLGSHTHCSVPWQVYVQVPRTCPQKACKPTSGPARATWASVLPRAPLSQPLTTPLTTHLPRPAWPAHAPFPLCLVCRFRFPPLNTRRPALVSPSPPPTTPRLSSHFRFFNLPVHRRPIASSPSKYILFLTLFLNIGIAYFQRTSICLPVDHLGWTGLDWQRTGQPTAGNKPWPRVPEQIQTAPLGWWPPSNISLNPSHLSTLFPSQPRPSTELTCITQLFLRIPTLHPPIQIRDPTAISRGISHRHHVQFRLSHHLFADLVTLQRHSYPHPPRKISLIPSGHCIIRASVPENMF